MSEGRSLCELWMSEPARYEAPDWLVELYATQLPEDARPAYRQLPRRRFATLITLAMVLEASYLGDTAQQAFWTGHGISDPP